MTQQDDIIQPVLTDDEILLTMRAHLNYGDGGYVCDTAPETVIAAGRALLSKLRAPVADERQPDGKRPDLDWIEGVQVTNTVGRGWCVRIDGTDIFEDVNRYGCKGRRSFQIAAGLPSKQEAERAAVEWLDRQRAALASAPVAGEAQPVCWIEKDVLESVRDEGSDAWVYWRPAGHVAEPDEMPLYAAPQASAAPVAFSKDGVLFWYGDHAEWRGFNGDLYLAPQASEAVSQPLIARALDEWHEDDGPVTWWAWCGHEWAGEAPWFGTPLDQDWPGYHTHWTPIPGVPAALPAPQASAENVRNSALEEAAHLMEQTGKRIAAADIRALKQPQADKDGGQQRDGDVDDLRFIAGTIFLHLNGPQDAAAVMAAARSIKEWYDGQHRAALSATQPEQGERE